MVTLLTITFTPFVSWFPERGQVSELVDQQG